MTAMDETNARPGAEAIRLPRATARMSKALPQDVFGVRLRADLLHAVMETRAGLADLRLPLPARVATARASLRKARLLLKVCRDSLGPAYAPRAARLKLCAGALKTLAAASDGQPIGLVFTVTLQVPETDRRVQEVDALLRRCEVDAVSLAPGLIDAVGAAQALAKARRQSAARGRKALKSKDPAAFRKWLKALRRQVDMARLLAAEWQEPAAPSLFHLSAQAEDLARYLKVDALYRRLCAQRANGSTPLSSPDAVRLECKALLRRLEDRQDKANGI